ncbi:MAG: hypothetical protein C4B58_15735 [Deltaproteobacteria bacterium]|nr:MAG: hypothetical protein C4B58_15735 [Deltaproteobacteria bacterium]
MNQTYLRLLLPRPIMPSRSEPRRQNACRNRTSLKVQACLIKDITKFFPYNHVTCTSLPSKGQSNTKKLYNNTIYRSRKKFQQKTAKIDTHKNFLLSFPWHERVHSLPITANMVVKQLSSNYRENP